MANAQDVPYQSLLKVYLATAWSGSASAKSRPEPQGDRIAASEHSKPGTTSSPFNTARSVISVSLPS